MKYLQSLGILICSIIIGSCAKEYSYEGGNANPVPPPVTSPAPATDEIPACVFCKTITTTELSTWNFKVGNTTACGKADTAFTTVGRTAFTFFGPSSCSRDTGIVITWYLRDTLNKNLTNSVADKVSFFYYDRVTPSYIFMSQYNTSFWGVIQSYDHQTKIASGIFNGLAFRSNGIGVNIESGKFKVRLL